MRGGRRAARRLAQAAARPLRSLRRWSRSLAARPGAPSGVHLSWSEDPNSTLTITWQTPTRENGEVMYRRADGGAAQRAVASTRRLRGTSHWRHEAVLRGLAPGTSYSYRIVSRCDSASADGAWSVACTAPNSRSASYCAVFLCDVGLAGRSDRTTEALPEILNALASDPPLFYLGGGDYAYRRRDDRFRDAGDVLDRWFEQMAPLWMRAPFMAQFGNHEVELDENLGDWAARFAHPRGSPDGYSYSFGVGAAHFVGLFAPGRAPTPLHLRWLEEDLSREAARTAAWRIVYQHAPVFASGSSHPARAEVRAMMPLFERLGVNLHLSGHDQNYERTHPVRGSGWEPPLAGAGEVTSYAACRGVIYAKVSPAGKLSERGLDFSRFTGAQAPEVAARDDRAHHWARLCISDAQLAVEVFGLSGDGAAPRIVDRFALRPA
jgi:hypothetical protein